MSHATKFLAKIQDELWYFPYGVGKGSGHQVDRASPNKHPYWVITPAYLPRCIIPVTEDEHRLMLLKLPRNKHD